MRVALHAAFASVLAIPTLCLASAGDTAHAGLNPKPEQVKDYSLLGDVLGARVSMRAGDAATREATKERETAARPNGKITDLLVDCCTGETQWAVVTFDKTLGFGGKTVAMPCDQLRWNVANQCFDMDQSDEQLKALPSFDCADAKKRGIDLTVSELTTHWPTAVIRAEASPAQNGAARNAAELSKQTCPTLVVDGQSFERSRPQLVIATDLDDDTVYANGEKFGSISECIVDRANHKIALVVVSHGGTLGANQTDYLFPFHALCMHGGNDGKDRMYASSRTTRELENGVKYEKPKQGAVDSDAVRRAFEMFPPLAPKQHSSAQ